MSSKFGVVVGAVPRAEDIKSLRGGIGLALSSGPKTVEQIVSFLKIHNLKTSTGTIPKESSIKNMLYGSPEFVTNGAGLFSLEGEIVNRNRGQPARVKSSGPSSQKKPNGLRAYYDMFNALSEDSQNKIVELIRSLHGETERTRRMMYLQNKLAEIQAEISNLGGG